MTVDYTVDKNLYVIIAGSRTLDKDTTYRYIKESGISHLICQIVSGGQRSYDIFTKKYIGCDFWGEMWALENSIPIKRFDAKWSDLITQPLLIKYNKQNQPYNALAGFTRNIQMAEYLQHKQPNVALIAICKNKSPGTLHMIEIANEYNIPVIQFHI